MENPAIKVRRQINYWRPVLQKTVTYREVELNETVKIRRRQISVKHYYWVPLTADLADIEAYLLPLDDPDCNTRRDWQNYRERYQILSGAAVKKSRTTYGLSGREMAAIIGISHSSLSEIENELVLQSDEQDSLLRLAQNRLAFVALVRTRRASLTEAFDEARYRAILAKVQA